MAMLKAMPCTVLNFLMAKLTPSLLVVSVLINAMFTVAGVCFVAHKGGIAYLQAKVAPKDGIVFLGDSLTNLGDWSEDLHVEVVNMGIRGDETSAIISRVDSVISRRPRVVFLMAGTNDALQGRSIDSAIHNYSEIVKCIHAANPSTLIYVQSVLPVTDRLPTAHPLVKSRVLAMNQWIESMNSRIAALADNKTVFFVNIHDDLLQDGELDPRYTIDGVHLTHQGYKVWEAHVFPFIER